MLKLVFQKPSTMNQMLNVARSNRFASAKLKKSETIRAKNEVVEQTKLKLLPKQVYIIADIGYNRISSDPDNQNTCLKPILDGMVKAELLRDDSFKNVQPFMFFTYHKCKKGEENVIIYLSMDKTEYTEAIMAYFSQD